MARMEQLALLPSEILDMVVEYLDVRSYAQLRGTCKDFHLLEMSERYWETVMRNEIRGDVSLLTLKEGVTWRDVVTSLWKDIKIDWWEVISDPNFYQTLSFLHLEAPHEIFEVDATNQKQSTKLLMDWESLFNSYEDHDSIESLFDDSSSDIFTFMSNISSFTFTLPGDHELRLCLSAEVNLFIRHSQL
jgi:hypothetical protein